MRCHHHHHLSVEEAVDGQWTRTWTYLFFLYTVLDLQFVPFCLILRMMKKKPP